MNFYPFLVTITGGQEPFFPICIVNLFEKKKKNIFKMDSPHPTHLGCRVHKIRIFFVIMSVKKKKKQNLRKKKEKIKLKLKKKIVFVFFWGPQIT